MSDENVTVPGEEDNDDELGVDSEGRDSVKSCESLGNGKWKSPPKAMVSMVVAEKYRKFTQINLLLSKENMPVKCTGAKTNPLDRTVSKALSFLPAPSKMMQSMMMQQRKAKAPSQFNRVNKEKGINVATAETRAGSLAPPKPKPQQPLQSQPKQTEKSATSKKKKKAPKIANQSKPLAKSKVESKVEPSNGDDTKPLSDEQMEELNDELADLNNSVATLRFSMKSVIGSLCSIECGRARTRVVGETQPVTKLGNNADKKCIATGAVGAGTAVTIQNNNKTNAPQALDEWSDGLSSVSAHASVDYKVKYPLDRFIQSDTRSEAFANFLTEHAQLNKAMTQFGTFFNSEGCFRRQAYEAQTEVRLSASQHRQCLRVIKSFSGVVTAILKAYNEDKLNSYLNRSSRYR